MRSSRPTTLRPNRVKWRGARQNHPIVTMMVVTAALTLGGMFERRSKSSSAVAPGLELSPRAHAGDPTGMRDEHLREWRDAANHVVSAYKAWCAANSRDRQELYIAFVDALGREERAAQQVERDASAPAAAGPGDCES